MNNPTSQRPLAKTHAVFYARLLRHRLSICGMLVLILITLGAILAPSITGQTSQYSLATDTHIELALQGPSGKHPLGTDAVGRDVLARFLFGARVSLTVGIVSMLVSLLISVIIGAIAGFYGGLIDIILMRITDVFLSVPLYLILFVLSASFSNGTLLSTILLIAILSWGNTARIVRAEFLRLRKQDFVLAGRSIGATNARLVLGHILPNVASPIIVSATLMVGGNILAESTLSFFNFGIQPPQPSWGTMLAESRGNIWNHPTLVLVPGLGIVVTALCINLVGDGLRDALDPYIT